MALPNKTNLETMDYSYSGLPFVDVPAKSTIDTSTMDYSYGGLPFVTNPANGATPSGPTHLKSMFGVPLANIKTINGIPIANVKTFSTID